MGAHAIRPARATSIESLPASVCGTALEDAGLGPADIDAVSVGVYSNGFSPQSIEGELAGTAMPDLAVTSA